MHGVAAADGENAEPAVVLQRHHGGGAHLLGLVLEQGLQLLAAQHAAHRLAGTQQRRQRLRQVVRVDEAHLLAHFAEQLGFPVVQQQRHGVAAEFLFQAAQQLAQQLVGAARFQQRQGQAAGVLEQLVVFPGHVDQAVEPLAQLLVALAQDRRLALQQRNRRAARVRQAHQFQQVGALLEEFRVLAQKGGHLVGAQLGVVGHAEGSVVGPWSEGGPATSISPS
jgi:hypothetical protein